MLNDWMLMRVGFDFKTVGKRHGPPDYNTFVSPKDDAASFSVASEILFP